MIGETILRYRIIEKISEGGMGVVYRAEDTQLDRVVALKFLPYHLSSDSTEKQRFINEAKALATLNHPNVAAIYGIEEYDGKSFIIMEFVEGSSLRKLINNGEFLPVNFVIPIDKIMNVFTQIVLGLQAAHNKHIVHRDIKPENIIITPDGQVKILDFGLAKMAGREHLTSVGTTMGTIAYMSPEQTRGDVVDQRTDLWSAGVILYEMISGRRPFRGEYDQAVIYSILNETPDPLPIANLLDKEKLRRIISRTLAKNPDDRYQNTEELLKEIRSNEIPARLHAVKTPSNVYWKIILAGIIFFAVLLYIFYPRFLENKSYGKKIAVLPFLNMGNDPNEEYLSDGIMEDVLTQLVKISDLKVISRTTMMKYKNTNKTMQEISSELNADVVLEGSVRKEYDLLRISVQLIDAKNDEHLWAETYDRNIKDVFAVQRQIAIQIAGTLQAKLSPHEKQGIDKLRVISPDAYNADLEGRYFLDKRTRESIEKAIGYFKQSIAFDSTYAQPWAGLSKAHSIQADMGITPTDSGYASARFEAEKAMKLDPNFAEAYARRAWIKMTYDWDWKGADEDYKQALKLEPGNAAIIQSAGVLASVQGNLDKAIELCQRSIELNPLLSTPYYNLALYYYYAHKWDKAKAAVLKVLELNAEYPDAHVLLGRIYLAESKPKEALAEVKIEKEIPWQKFGFVLVYHALGMKTEENTSLAQFIKEHKDDSAYQIAEIYSFRGDADSTFIWLERAYQLRDGGLGDIKGDPLMENVEKDPRYAAFMKKMNLF